MSRVPDPGRLPKAVLIKRVAAQLASAKLKSLRAALGNKRDFSILPGEWAAPDSAIAQEAEKLATLLYTPIVLAHAQRTYCFGAVLAARDRLKLDRELFYIAALLHDLGLTEQYEADPGSFEWVGAKKAREFCIERGLSELKADLVHDAVALHTSFGIATSREPEVAMVHYGAGLDILGRRIDDVPKESLMTIVERYPRNGCKEHFVASLRRQSDLKPDSHIAGHVALGLPDRIIDTLY